MSEQSNLHPIGASQLKALERAVSQYEEALDYSVDALMYLDGRGLSQETVKAHRIGLVGGSSVAHPQHRGRIVIPYLAPDGQPLTLRFHCFEEHEHFGHGKYNTLPDDPVRMFNVGAVLRAVDEIHVTEGEFDAMALGQVGLPAIAIPGAQAWRYHHADLLAGFSSIFVWADPDSAGQELAQRVTRALRQAVSLTLPSDVNDLYLQGGEQAIRDLLKEQR